MSALVYNVPRKAMPPRGFYGGVLHGMLVIHGQFWGFRVWGFWRSRVSQVPNMSGCRVPLCNSVSGTYYKQCRKILGFSFVLNALWLQDHGGPQSAEER